MPLAAVDHAALLTCLQIVERDPEFVEQQKGRPWRERAEAACFRVQIQALNLKPWQLPPCSVDEDDPNELDNKAAQKLLRLMLANDVSRYDPDPLAALKRRRRRKNPGSLPR